jgi:hypothetical protein
MKADSLSRRAARIFSFLTSFGLCVLLTTGYAQEAGKINRMNGDITINTSAGKKSAKAGDLVMVGDTIESGKDSEAFIKLKDNSTLIVRPKSKLQISEFKFEKKSTDTAKTLLIEGSLRAVSGQLSKGKPDSVKFQAGTATIGIRGTDIDLAIVPEGSKDRAGIYNYVSSGEVVMALDSGESLIVPKESTGFSPAKPEPGEPRLQLLRDRPGFFLSGAFDALMQQLMTPQVPMGR